MRAIFFDNSLNNSVRNGFTPLMPARFVNLHRQRSMFLPCDLRERLPADHLVNFILDAV